MRLTSFALEHYGNFEAVRLSLDPDPGRVNLVVAPNGGGKTVLRQAFRDLLFGIPGQTKMAFRFGYGGMQLIAEGTDDRGAAFAIRRRKGIGNTLFDGRGNGVDQQAFKGLIGEVDEALFERLFALDSHLLRAGAAAMLASGGDFAEALFAAGSGVASLRRVREEFEELRDRLAPERKSKLPPFYQALDALAKARSDLRAATVRPRAWEDLNAQLIHARGHLASLVAEEAKGRGDIKRLERVRRVRPWLESRQAARQRLAAADGAPRLPADIEEQWRQARQAVVLAERDRAEAMDNIEKLTASLAAEEPASTLLDEGERIDGLEQARDQIAESHGDLPLREAERGHTAALLEEILAALGVKSAEEIAAIAPNGPPIAAARALIKQHGGLDEKLRNADADAATTARDITAAEADLERLGEPRDARELAALMVEARADGDPARRLAELRETLSQEEARLAAALARMPLWTRGLEALAALVPPTGPMIERAAGALDAAARALAEAEGTLERLGDERGRAVERLAREREGKPVPDKAAIEEARAHRDLGWSLIRRSRFEGEALAAEIAAYAGPLGVTAAFERAIGEADRLADRRDEEGRRLARIAEQERAIAALDRKIADAEERRAAAREAHGRAAHEWVALAAALGLAGEPAPQDVREILTARLAVLDIRSARDAAAHAVDAEARRQDSLLARFARLLSAEQCSSLTAALAAAQQTLDRAAAIRKERDRVETQLATFRRLHQAALARRGEAGKAIAEWQAEWRQCLTVLGRAADETPASVEQAIELIAAAHRERRKLRELDHRIAGMKQRIADYEARVAAAAAAAAPDLAGQPAESAAAELRRRLRGAREVESRRALLVRQVQDARAKSAQAAARHRDADARLRSLRAMIGGTDDEDIESRIALAAQRREAEAKVSEAEAKLAELGDGWPIEALEREAAEIDAQSLESELARLERDASLISEEREKAARDEQRLCDGLHRIGAGEDAIEAEERRQAALASLGRISAEALLYHAAGSLLRQAAERLRDSDDGGLVRRIGAAFARITGGAYAGVAADEDDKGAPFLIAIEADGRTEKRVPELSEGTRDQLFLALRLVMLEDYAQKAAVPPFIADDLLQTFDDYGRTANALAALADLSHHVQVIVLSHQRHLIEAARALPAGTVNLCELAT
jgi:uncharacterized protein YhaN